MNDNYTSESCNVKSRCIVIVGLHIGPKSQGVEVLRINYSYSSYYHYPLYFFVILTLLYFDVLVSKIFM